MVWKNLTDLNPIEHLQDESEWRLRARLSRPTSVFDIYKFTFGKTISINTFLNLVESLTRGASEAAEAWRPTTILSSAKFRIFTGLKHTTLRY